MKKAFFALAVLTTALSTHAADTVEGAFGLKFGEVFQPGKEAVSKFGFNGGFEFTPAKPNAAFSTYLVFVTPTDHLIYKIVAIGIGDYPTSSKTVETIRAILSQKYGDSSGSGEIRQGNRNVSVVEGQSPIGQNRIRVMPQPGLPAAAPPVATAPSDNAAVPIPRLPTGYEKYYAVVYMDLTLSSQADHERSENHLKELLKDADPTGL